MGTSSLYLQCQEGQGSALINPDHGRVILECAECVVMSSDRTRARLAKGIVTVNTDRPIYCVFRAVARLIAGSIVADPNGRPSGMFSTMTLRCAVHAKSDITQVPQSNPPFTGPLVYGSDPKYPVYNPGTGSFFNFYLPMPMVVGYGATRLRFMEHLSICGDAIVGAPGCYGDIAFSGVAQPAGDHLVEIHNNTLIPLSFSDGEPSRLMQVVLQFGASGGGRPNISNYKFFKAGKQVMDIPAPGGGGTGNAYYVSFWIEWGFEFDAIYYTQVGAAAIVPQTTIINLMLIDWNDLSYELGAKADYPMFPMEIDLRDA